MRVDLQVSELSASAAGVLVMEEARATHEMRAATRAAPGCVPTTQQHPCSQQAAQAQARRSHLLHATSQADAYITPTAWWNIGCAGGQAAHTAPAAALPPWGTPPPLPRKHKSSAMTEETAGSVLRLLSHLPSCCLGRPAARRHGGTARRRGPRQLPCRSPPSRGHNSPPPTPPPPHAWLLVPAACTAAQKQDTPAGAFGAPSPGGQAGACRPTTTPGSASDHTPRTHCQAQGGGGETCLPAPPGSQAAAAGRGSAPRCASAAPPLPLHRPTPRCGQMGPWTHSAPRRRRAGQ
jgi:hypothetical protein